MSFLKHKTAQFVTNYRHESRPQMQTQDNWMWLKRRFTEVQVQYRAALPENNVM